MNLKLQRIAAEKRWYFVSFVLLLLFLLYTAIFASGIFTNLTLSADQWLLHRPLTGADCVFRQWKLLGDLPFSSFLTVVLGIVCLWLRYRKRVLLYIVLLLVLGLGVEFVGKQVFSQPVPDSLGYGMNVLACPQELRQPRSVRLMIMLGMWWDARPASARAIRKEQYSATTPFSLADTTPDNGYPSGHAIRWSFLGIVAGWLCWRHVRRRFLRGLLMAIAFAIAVAGGLIMFYIGLHLLTDVIAGYLFGASLACCAIALLLRNEKKSRFV
ncbi:MAG TPA: phosphatase PAP2 family protein [Ktedonobacteraceae bacterium]|nr:phosphatase PAP2 family protein [Ktedonobacteraceae bacterium]